MSRHEWTRIVREWIVRGGFGALLLIVYLNVSADGMRTLFDPLSRPLCKTGLWPLTLLGNFAETRKLDLAHVLSLTMMLMVLATWEKIAGSFSDGNLMTNDRKLNWAAGTVILSGDAILFFVGITQGGFMGGASIFAGLVLTAIYVALVVCLGNWTSQLSRRTS